MPRQSRAVRLLSSQASNDDGKYTIAIDFGTKTASIAYRPPYVQYPLQSGTQIKQVLFDNHLFDTEVIATWLRGGRGRFCWGSELKSKVLYGEVSPENVLKLPKLQLYEDLQNDVVVKNEKAKLERLGKTLDQLIEELLYNLYECCRASIKSQEKLKTLSVDDKDFRVLLCVPQNFSNSQTERIMKLAIQAQIPQPRVVSEAECAAAYHFQGIVDIRSHAMPISCKAGDVILVGDAGGGTFDGGAFRFEIDAQNGSSTHLLPVPGTLFGNLSGSEFINQNFLHWLEHEWKGRITYSNTGAVSELGSLSSLLPELGISVGFALEQATSDFDTCKAQWEDNYRWSKSVTISGDTEIKSTVIVLDTHMMRRFFKPVVDEILDTLAARVTTGIKYVCLTGGLSKSMYLENRAKKLFNDSLLNEHFLPQDDRTHPVACGAILRYQNIAFEIPEDARVSFGIVNAQEAFDPEIHPDACDSKGRPLLDVVADDFWDRYEQGVVLDRISRWFTLTETERSAEEAYWQIYEPETNNLKMSARVCYSARKDLEDHEPLYGRDKKIRANIHELTEKFEVDVDPKKYGYKPKWADNGDCYYSVQAAIVLSSIDGVLTFKWYIARAGQGPWNEMGEEIRSAKAALRLARLLHEKEHAIHDLRWILRDRLKV